MVAMSPENDLSSQCGVVQDSFLIQYIHGDGGYLFTAKRHSVRKHAMTDYAWKTEREKRYF